MNQIGKLKLEIKSNNIQFQFVSVCLVAAFFFAICGIFHVDVKLKKMLIPKHFKKSNLKLC